MLFEKFRGVLEHICCNLVLKSFKVEQFAVIVQLYFGIFFGIQFFAYAVVRTQELSIHNFFVSRPRKYHMLFRQVL